MERRKDKKKISATHQCKYLNNHCNHYNVYSHTKKCWKSNLELNPKNRKKGAKKKNLMANESRN